MKLHLRLIRNTAVLTGLAFSATLAGCWYINEPEPRAQSPASTQGYAPVYDSAGTTKLIKAEAPRSIVSGGKIYAKGDVLYQVENGKGIHIIDISNPKAPVKLKFISISGCQELSMMDQYLYVNNLNDLVVVDLSNINNPVVKDRISNTFHIFDPNYPPAAGWYECPDVKKGVVVGWELKTLKYPQCR